MISVLFDSLQSHLHSGQGFTGASVVVVVVNISAKIITLHGEKCDIYSEIYPYLNEVYPIKTIYPTKILLLIIAKHADYGHFLNTEEV